MIDNKKITIGKKQENSNYGLCGDRDDAINYINECSKSAPKEYKTTFVWGVIYWELCRKFQFDQTSK